MTIPEKFEFEGQMLTAREIHSLIGVGMVNIDTLRIRLKAGAKTKAKALQGKPPYRPPVNKGFNSQAFGKGHLS